MAYNNTVQLTGNLGTDPEIIEGGEKPFAVLSLATTDSYKDKSGAWQPKETVWHRVIVFAPKVVDQVKHYQKGDRLAVTGSLSYKPREINDNGQSYKIMEASVIAGKVEEAPLPKKEPDRAMEPG